MAESEASWARPFSDAHFHPVAEREMLAAARYYQRQRSGLGEDFLRMLQPSLTDT